MEGMHNSTSPRQSDSVYDAVLLAGDRGASRQVCGRNKSFLDLDGIPLFIHVLRALQRAERIKRICIVGPYEQLVAALTDHQVLPGQRDTILVCEQGDSLLQNVWKAFLFLCPEAEAASPLPSALSEKAVLYISGDIPLVTPFEIDTFLQRCDTARYDYFLGIASAEHLQVFGPQRGLPGIRTHFFHIREGRYRQNNLHLVKPLRVANRTYIQKVYDYRYQRDMRNILRLAREFIKVHVGWKGLWCYALLHWNQLLSRMRLSPLTVPTRALLSLSFVEHCVSRVLGTRFVATVTPMVGAVLDIDNEADYKAMCALFATWQRYLAGQEHHLRGLQDSCAAEAQSGTRVA